MGRELKIKPVLSMIKLSQCAYFFASFFNLPYCGSQTISLIIMLYSPHALLYGTLYRFMIFSINLFDTIYFQCRVYYQFAFVITQQHAIIKNVGSTCSVEFILQCFIEFFLSVLATCCIFFYFLHLGALSFIVTINVFNFSNDDHCRK